ncbi:MAG: V-type ATPase subunit [Oscillospiraceae bacterium]
MAHASLAIIPKARGMYAKRMRPAEYEELMRRRTVPEVAALLKKHPYFGDSLATLSPVDPHREQLEELLNMDIFNKYEALMRYDFTSESFAFYFIIECEVIELLRAMRMISTGMANRYIRHLPPFLEGKIRFDLFRLAEARSFGEMLEVLRYTPYYKVLRPLYQKDPALRDYPGAEAVMIRFYYACLFELAAKHLPPREEKAVRTLFLQEAELYNVNVVFRSKIYFGEAYGSEQIRRMLLPYRYRLSPRRLDEMLAAKSPEQMMEIYHRAVGLAQTAGPVDMEAFDAETGRLKYRQAQRVLHLTTSPSAALAAFIALAKLERDNVVNIIEGVRYGLTPEEIRALLRC